MRHPLEVVRHLVVFLNVRPFTYVFHVSYRLGLRFVLSRLSRHDTIHAVYGTGSFFRGASLYGHSDIDLVIVLREHVKRAEGVQYRLGRTYERVRRVFPFLGSWSEKEGSLIFLDEIAAGFPAPVPFRVLFKNGDLTRLWGEEFPDDFGGADVDAREWTSEVVRLLRWAALASERAAWRAVFWQRMFTKLARAARGLGVDGAVAVGPDGRELDVLAGSARRLFFTMVDPVEMFDAYLQAARRIFAEVRQGPGVTVESRPYPREPEHPSPVEIPSFAAIESATAARRMASGPIGLLPKLFYFSVDDEAIVVDTCGRPYRDLKKLLQRMKAEAVQGDTIIARMDGFLFLLDRVADYVDLLPLDPVLAANVYARLEGRSEFEVPETVLGPLRAESDRVFVAVRRAYERHTGWLPKHDYPAIYREDDLDTLRDAFDIVRAYIAHRRSLWIYDSAGLFRYLAETYPNARPFLDALAHYRRFLRGGGRGAPPANNLYRCIHQLVSGVLSGDETLEIDDFDLHLGITVGIVTRNRADDLKHALASLRDQTRPPDEIVLVDNGSSDATRTVIEAFEDELPIRYFYLADASIPNARNVVLEECSQEVVAFTDDDCAIPPEWLSSVERGFLRADNVGIVGGWVEHWPAETSTTVDLYYEIFHNHKT